MADAPLFQTEAEIAKRLGVKLEEWERVARVWEREGLPRPSAHFHRRYWPAVKAWLDRRAGLRQDGPTPDGVERW